MTDQDTTTAERVIDVREISPRVRHDVIFQLFQNLRPAQGFTIVNDHDPKPLHFQFQARFGGHFQWTYLEQGPDLWRVRISRAGQPAEGATQ